MAKSDDKIDYIKERVEDVARELGDAVKEIASQKTLFEAHTKQDEKMYEELKRMNDILQQNTESLQEHMHRTDLLESLVKRMDERLTPLEIGHIEKAAVNAFIKNKVIMFAKVIGAISAGAALIVAVKSLI